MDKRTEIEKAIKTCIAIEQSCDGFDGRRLAKQIMRVENELGVVIKVDRELPKKNKYWGTKDKEKLESFDHKTKLVWGDERYEQSQQDMLKWHNDSFEPLIEGE